MRFSRKLIKFLFLVLAVLLVFSIVKIANTEPKTETAYYSTIENTINASGYLIRNESVITAPFSGTLVANVTEGERVPKGSNVAFIYKGEVDPVIEKKLQAVNARIEQITASQSKNDWFVSENFTVDQQITEIINSVIDYAKSKNLSKLGQTKDSINQLLSKRDSITGQKAAADLLESLKKEKASYEAKFSGNRVSLYAPVAGVFSAKIDNCETLLRTENVNKLTVGDIKVIDTVKPPEIAQITAGKPACKIIDNHEWYVAAVIDSEQVEGMKEGDSVKIRFADLSSEPVSAEVYYISQPEDKSLVCALKSSHYVEGLWAKRKVSFEIIKRKFTGLKVSLKAIRVVNDATGVYVMSPNGPVFKDVEIEYKGSDFALVKENSGRKNYLELYDRVIIGGNE